MSGRGKARLWASKTLLCSDSNVTNLINSHYASMNAGIFFSEHIEDYPNLLQFDAVPDFHRENFHGISNISGLHFPSEESIKLMPLNPIPAIMHCLHFERSKLTQKFSVASFYGETGMRELLLLKGKSAGKNTDKFGQYNCILTNGVLPHKKPRHTFLIHDDTNETINGTSVTKLDAFYATKKKMTSSHVFYDKRSVATESFS